VRYDDARATQKDFEAAVEKAGFSVRS